MPIFEYKCEDERCEHISDYFSKSLKGGRKIEACERCGWVAKKIPSRPFHANKEKGKP